MNLSLQSYINIMTTDSKIKHEWFQNPSAVTVSIYAKNVPPADVSVTFQPRNLSVALPLAASEFQLDLDLAHEIVPEESTYIVLKSLVEIKMKKKREGVMWNVLEGEDTEQILLKLEDKKPEYPSSSKKVL